jgi:hypothetical protein
MKPELKAPGINLLILTFDETLSTFAINFNLRCYILDYCTTPANIPASVARRAVAAAREVGPARYCPPHHPTHFKPFVSHPTQSKSTFLGSNASYDEHYMPGLPDTARRVIRRASSSGVLR